MSIFDELNPPYSTIVADPPWPFRWRPRTGQPHMTTTMTVQDYIRLSKPDRERFACTHLARNEDGQAYVVDGEVATTTRTYPVTTPPPAWAT